MAGKIELADLPTMEREVRERAFNYRTGRGGRRSHTSSLTGGGGGASGTDYAALAVSNSLTVIGYFRADLGVTGTSGTGKASWANQSGAMSAITPHGSATNGIGSVGAGLNGKASLIQDGSSQKGLFTAPALAAAGTTNVHKYWIGRQIIGNGTPRGMLQETGGAMDVYLNSAVGVTFAGTGAAGQNLTNNTFERYRVSWTGAVATNEAKIGSQAVTTGTGTNVTPNTSRIFSDLLTNFEWLLYIEVTGPKANFLTFATAADTAARTVDWTTAIEV